MADDDTPRRPGRLTRVVLDRDMPECKEIEYLCEYSNSTFDWKLASDVLSTRKGFQLVDEFETRTYAPVRGVSHKRKRRGIIEYKLQFEGFGRACDKWIAETHLPGFGDLTGAKLTVNKPRTQSTCEVKAVLAQRTYGCYGEKMYLLRWAAYPTEADSWVPAKDLNFSPSASVPVFAEVPAEAGVAPPARTRRMPKKYADRSAEWTVFRDFFLPDIQHQLRFGWRTARSLTGRVRSAIGSFCPPTAYELLLSNSGKVSRRGPVAHHTFATAADVPALLAPFDAESDGPELDPVWGQVEQSWWRNESTWAAAKAAADQPASPHDTRRLFMITGPVVFHYHRDKLRLTVSFTYSYATRSTASPFWNTQIGPRVPFT
jgi:hypothetical protein